MRTTAVLTAVLAPDGPGATASGLERGTMVLHRAGEPVPQEEFTDLGPPEALGGRVLEGDGRISARVDHTGDGELAGVFQATRGRALIHFRSTEHATVISGQVRLTDPWGNRATLGAGDSYLVQQGTDILWEVSGARVQGSFFNRTTGADAPAPMGIHRAGEEVPQDELTDLGAPEDLGGTVRSGDPRIAARIDHADGPLLAGVFQATCGDAQIHFPFTEHATITAGDVTLTDERGTSAKLAPGDSYLIAQDSSIRWEVACAKVQKSFLNITRSRS